MQRARYGKVQTSRSCVYVCTYIMYIYTYTYTYIAYTQVIHYTYMYVQECYAAVHRLWVCVCAYIIYIYIHTHTYTYIGDTLYIHLCTKVIRCRASQACLGWCIHECELTCTCMHTLIRCSATAKTCKGSSSKPFCASTNSQQKKVVFLTRTWNGQICV